MGRSASPGPAGGKVSSPSSTGRVRPATAAGTFYPNDPEELAVVVDAMLAAAASEEAVGSPLAIVVPHAGYVYSGSVAATAYSLLRANALRRVALLGPAHFVSLLGAAVPEAGAWATPLGEVPIDAELREVAVRCGATVDDGPHALEHSLEVQLPFLQRIAGDRLTVLPVAVGLTSPEEVAELIAALAESALVVISTDLSHYHKDATAKRIDRMTADAVLARNPSAIGPYDACGVHALRGAVEFAKRRDLEVRLLDLRTSADTAGDPDRVVGYGAFALGLRAGDRARA